MTFSSAALLALLLPLASGQLALVPGWPAGLLGLNITRLTAGAVVGAGGARQVLVAQRGTVLPFMLLLNAETGALEGSWSGSPDLTSPHGLVAAADGTSVWVADIGGASVSLFTAAEGHLLATIGTHGKPGSGTSPPQFSAPADIAPRKGGGVLVSDGDGGKNSRVALLSPDATAPGGAHWLWGVGGNGSALGQFDSPHSIALQAGTDTAWVADRGNNRLQALDAATGTVRGVWEASCFGGGQPWAVRVDEPRARLFVGDGLFGRVYVLNVTDAGGESGSAPLGSCSPSTLLQTLDIGAPLIPHELAVDSSSGDLYVAALGPPAWLFKYASV